MPKGPFAAGLLANMIYIKGIDRQTHTNKVFARRHFKASKDGTTRVVCRSCRQSERA